MEDIKRIVRRAINERLGVPDNITQVAEHIFNVVSSELLKNPRQFTSSDYSETIGVEGSFRVGKHVFDEIYVTVKTEDNPDRTSEPAFTTFQVITPAEIKNYRYVLKEKDVLRMNIIVAVGEQWSPKEIGQIMIRDRHDKISVLAHELHHAYINKSEPSSTLHSKSEYKTTQGIQLGGILPMNLFLYYTYYITAAESAVRPSELYSLMHTQEITKGQFLKFFKESEVIQTLQDIRKFKLSTLIQELHSNISNIDRLFYELKDNENFTEAINSAVTDDEKIDVFLDIIFQLILSTKMGLYHEILSTVMDPFLGFIAQFDPNARKEMERKGKILDNMYEKYRKHITKFKNYQDFFGNEEKRINFAADKLIRKLSKLYEMAKDDTSSSITNWDLHHKINKTAEKTMEEIKKLRYVDKTTSPKKK